GVVDLVRSDIVLGDARRSERKQRNSNEGSAKHAVADCNARAQPALAISRPSRAPTCPKQRQATRFAGQSRPWSYPVASESSGAWCTSQLQRSTYLGSSAPPSASAGTKA